MEEFVTHARLVYRKQICRKAGLKSMRSEGAGRHADKSRYCPEKQEFRMHT